MSHAAIRAARGKAMSKGVLIGVVNAGQVPEEVTEKYRGRIVADMRGGGRER
jgi:hypothetical protein